MLYIYYNFGHSSSNHGLDEIKSRLSSGILAIIQSKICLPIPYQKT